MRSAVLLLDSYLHRDVLRTVLCMPNKISENATTCALPTVRGAAARFLWCRKTSWSKIKNSSSFADLPWSSPCLPDHDEHEDRPALHPPVLLFLALSYFFEHCRSESIHGCQRPRTSCRSSQAISQDPWAPIGDNRHSNYVCSVGTRLSASSLDKGKYFIRRDLVNGYSKT